MKVLFLDIDGVINCRSTTQREDGFIGFDPKIVKLLKRIIEDTGCKVVLSSTWRLTERGRTAVDKKVCNFIDVTPSSNSGFRGNEVNAWLSAQAERGAKIERYAILDDDSDFYPNQLLFKTSWSTGLTEEISKEVTDYLNETN